MAKIKITHEIDYQDIPLLKLYKSKGKISRQEAYEAMEKEGHFGHYIMPINFCEETPDSLYEDDDTWELYTAEDFWPKASEELFGKGYGACMADYNLLGEEDGR